ncbi:hypothetical protein [Sporomusa carbonis]|uniref:hypothetical protein n=1 Tax=Sporomusa carbonis TaxID=3076075 RepID=UPI003C7D3128
MCKTIVSQRLTNRRLPLYGNTGLQSLIPPIDPAESQDLQNLNLIISKVILEKPGDSAELINDELTINLTQP